MKTFAMAALVACFAMPAVADSLSSPIDNDPNVINASCYRGALHDTIAWDHPNPVFVADLVQIGYSYPQANSIANMVCRDPRGLGNNGVRIQLLKDILRQTPPGS